MQPDAGLTPQHLPDAATAPAAARLAWLRPAWVQFLLLLLVCLSLFWFQLGRPGLFDSEAQRAFGENLSYTPWHSLAEHRPLGGINRARKVVYRAISMFRHECNHAPRREPTGWDIGA